MPSHSPTFTSNHNDMIIYDEYEPIEMPTNLIST